VTKADLHRLVDELPEESVDSLAVLLERAKDPMVAALEAAPVDDEPYTDAERAEDAAAIETFQRGEGRPLDEVVVSSTLPTESADSPPWRLVVSKAAEKDLARPSRNDGGRIQRDRLPAGEVRRPAGARCVWRLRVGDWRVRFMRDDSRRTIGVLRVLPRRAACKP
jgi:mRNA-degrading endonuclease RelE of RelBE toxin-antitoxin system